MEERGTAGGSGSDIPLEIQEKLLLKDAEFAKMVSKKNSEIIELTAKYEKELADKDAGWKHRMEVAINTCKEKLHATYTETIEAMKQAHANELGRSEASLRKLEQEVKMLTQAVKAKGAELEDKGEALEKLSVESRQHLDVLEAVKKPLAEQVSQLKDVVAVREKSIEDLQRARQTDSAELEESREKLSSLRQELRRKDAQWQQEKSEYLAKMRGFQTDNAKLQNDITRLQGDVARLELDRNSGIEDSARQLQVEKKKALEARKMVENEYRQQEMRLHQELQALKDAVAEGERKVQELDRQLKGKDETHALEIEAARREEKAKTDERVADAKKKVREDLESAFSRREQNAKSLADSQKEHELGMLRRELEREVDNERHSRTVLERKLAALKDQHKREAELAEAQTSGDRERVERRHATELSQKEEEARQQLEQVRMEREDVETKLNTEISQLKEKLATSMAEVDQLKEDVEGGVMELRQRQQEHAAQLEDASSRAQKDREAMKNRHKDELHALRQNLTNELHAVQTASAKCTEELQYARAQLDLKSSDNERLSEDVGHLRDEIDHLRRDYDTVYEKMETFKHESSCAEDEATLLKGRLEEVLAELEQLKASCDQSVLEASGLRIETKQAHAEVKKLKEQRDEAAAEHAQYVEDLQKDHEKLEERMREELDEVKDELATSEEGNMKLSEEVKKLREENHESKMKLIEMASLQETVKRLTKQLQASEEKYADLQTSMANMEQSMATLKLTHEQQVQTMNDNWTRQVQTLQEERASSETLANQLKLELQKKRDEVNSLRTKNGILATERDNFKADSERVKSRCEGLKMQVDQVRSDLRQAQDAARESRTNQDLVKMELDGVRRSYQQVCEEVAFVKHEYDQVAGSEAGSMAEGFVHSGGDLVSLSEVDGAAGSEHAQKQRQHMVMERTARSELATLRDLLTSRSAEVSHLSKTLAATREELKTAKQELQKLLRLESIVEELKSVKKDREKAEDQYNSTHHELVLSQQNVSALEDHLALSKRQYQDAQLELETLEGEREEIEKQMAELNLTLESKMAEHKKELQQVQDSLTRQCKKAESEIDRLKEELQHESEKSQKLRDHYSKLQDGYDSSLDTLRQDLDHVTEELSQCKLERDRATGQLEEVSQALEVSQEETKQMKEDCELAKEKVGELEKKCVLMAQEGDRKCQEMEEEVERVKRGHEQEVDALKLDLKKAEQESSTKDITCSKLSAEVSSLKDELQRARLKLTDLRLLDSAQEELGRLREQMAKSQAAYDSTVQKLDESQLEVVTMGDKLGACQKELRQLRVELDRLAADKTELEQRVVDLKAEVARKEVEHGHKMSSLRDELTGQVRQLKDQLEHRSTEHDRLRADYDTLKAERERSVHKLRMDYEHANKELVECKFQREKALAELNEARLALEEASEETDGLRTREDQLEEEAEDYRKKWEELDRQVTQLQGKCDSATAEYCKRIESVEMSKEHAQKEHQRKEAELRMELKSAEDDIQFRQEENLKLQDQTKSLRAELHEARLQLAKLHQLDTALEDVQRLKKQLLESGQERDDLLKELKSAKQGASVLEQQAIEYQRKIDEATANVCRVEKEREELKAELLKATALVDKCKIEYEHDLQGMKEDLTGRMNNIQQENRSAKLEIQDLQSQAQAESASKDLLQKELTSTKAELLKITLELDRANSSSQDLRLERDQIMGDVSKLRMEFEHANSEVQRLKLQLDLALSDTAKLHAQHDEASEERAKLEMELTEHAQKLKDKELDLEYVQEEKKQAEDIASAELSNLKEELSIKSNEYDRLTAQVKSLRNDLHESKLQLTKLHLLDSLQQEVDHLKEQLEEAQSRSETLSRELKASELRVLAMEDELPDSQHKCKKVAAELEAVEKERDLLEQQVAGLKKEVADLKAKYEEQLHAHLEEINSLRADNSTLLAKLEELAFQLDLKTTEAEQLRTERDTSREELAETTMSYEHAHSEEVKYQQELEGALRKLSKVESDCSGLHEEVEILRQKYAEAADSRSKLKIEWEGAKDEAEALRKEVDRLTTEHAQKMREKRQEFDGALKVREQDKQAVELELVSIKEELSFKSSEYTRLLEQLKSTKDELHDSKLQLVKLHEYESLQQEVRIIKQRLTTSQSQYQSTLDQLNASKLKSSSLEDKLLTCQRQKQEAEAERDSLKGKFERSSSEASKWKVEFDRVSVEVRSMKSEYEFLESESKRLKKECERLGNEAKEFRDKCETLSEEYSQAKLELEQASMNKSLMEKEMEHLTNEVKKLREECKGANSESSKRRIDADHLSGELRKVKLEKDLLEEKVRNHEKLLEEKRSEIKKIRDDHSLEVNKLHDKTTSLRREMGQLESQLSQSDRTHQQQTSKLMAEMQDLQKLYFSSMELFSLVQSALAQGDTPTHLPPLQFVPEYKESDGSPKLQSTGSLRAPHTGQTGNSGAKPVGHVTVEGREEVDDGGRHGYGVKAAGHTPSDSSTDTEEDGADTVEGDQESGEADTESDDKFTKTQKMTPSMDSGLASNFTELLPSAGTTLMATPSFRPMASIGEASLTFQSLPADYTLNSTGARLSMTPQPSSASIRMTGSPLRNLSMYPLDLTTAQSQNSTLYPLEASVMQDLDHTHTSQDHTHASEDSAPPTSKRDREVRSSPNLDASLVRANLTRFHNGVRTLASKYQSLLAELMRLQSQGERLKVKNEECAKLQAYYDQTKRDLAVATERNKTLEKTAEVTKELANETDVLVKKFKSLEEEKLDLEVQVNELKSRCEVRDEEVETGWKKLQMERETREEVERKLQQYQSEMESKLQLEQDHHRSLKEKHQTFVQTMSQFKAHKNQEVEQLKTEKARLIKQRDEALNERDAATREVEQLNAKIISLNAEIKKIMQECNTLQASLSEAESHLSSQEREHAGVMAEWTGKVRSLEAGQREVQLLKKEVEEVRELEASQKREVNRLEQRAQGLTLELQQKDGEYAALKSRLKECENSLQLAEKSRAMAQDQCQSLRNEVESAHQQLTEECERLEGDHQRQMQRLKEELSRRAQQEASTLKEEHQHALRTLATEHAHNLEMEKNRLKMELQNLHQQQLRKMDTEHFEKLNAERTSLSGRTKELEETYKKEMKSVTLEHAHRVEEERNRLKKELESFYQRELAKVTTDLGRKLEFEKERSAEEKKNLEIKHQRELERIRSEHAQKLEVEKAMAVRQELQKIRADQARSQAEVTETEEPESERERNSSIIEAKLLEEMAALETQHQREIQQLRKKHQDDLLREQQQHQEDLMRVQQQRQADLLRQQQQQQSQADFLRQQQEQVQADLLRQQQEQAEWLRRQQEHEDEEDAGHEGDLDSDPSEEGRFPLLEPTDEAWHHYDLDETNHALLLKIMQLGPSLLKESGQVKDLANGLRVEPTAPTVGPALIDQFTQLLQDVKTAKDGLPANDWKRQLLDAVEKILEQERDILTSAMAVLQQRGGPSAESAHDGGVAGTDRGIGTHSLMDCCRQLIEQLNHQGSLLEALRNSSNDPFVSEIKQLQSELGAVRSAHKREVEGLVSRLHDRDELVNKTRQLQAALDETKRAYHQTKLMKDELSSQQATDRNSLEGEIRRLQELLATAKSAHEQEKQASQELRSQLKVDHESLIAELEQLKEALAAAELAQEREKQEKGRLSKSLEDLRQSSSAVVQELQFQLELEKSQVKELVTRTATLYGELAGKDSNLTKMESENKKLLEDAQDHEELITQNHSLKNRLKALEGEKRSVEDAKTKVSQTVQALQQEISSGRSEEAKLRRSLTQSEASVSDLRAQLAEHRQGAESHSSDLRRTKVALESTRAELAKAQRDRKAFQTECTQLKNDLLFAKSSGELLAAERELTAKLRLQLDRAAEETNELKLELDRATNRNIQQEAQLQSQRPLLEELESGLNATKALDLYEKYRQAELHRKSLAFQKLYLQCHLDAFYQTQQVALKMMSDMGAPITTNPSFPPPSKYPRPYARFRAVAAAVRASIRFRYICRRKSEYLHSKMIKMNIPGNRKVEGMTNGWGKPSITLVEDTPRSMVPAPMSYLGFSGSQGMANKGLSSGIRMDINGFGSKQQLVSHSGFRSGYSNHSSVSNAGSISSSKPALSTGRDALSSAHFKPPVKATSSSSKPVSSTGKGHHSYSQMKHPKSSTLGASHRTGSKYGTKDRK